MTSPKSVDKACSRAGPWMPGPVKTDKHARVAATEDQVKGIFNRYDANKDGFLGKQELTNAFASLGSRMPGVRASLALRHADVNSDGYVSQAEFDTLIIYTLKRGYKFK